MIIGKIVLVAKPLTLSEVPTDYLKNLLVQMSEAVVGVDENLEQLDDSVEVLQDSLTMIQHEIDEHIAMKKEAETAMADIAAELKRRSIPTMQQFIEQSIAKYGNGYTRAGGDPIINISQVRPKTFTVDIPSANTEWLISAFKWVTQFITDNPKATSSVRENQIIVYCDYLAIRTDK